MNRTFADLRRVANVFMTCSAVVHGLLAGLLRSLHKRRRESSQPQASHTPNILLLPTTT